MRRLHARVRPHWEFLLSAALFLICAYAAVFYVVNGALGAAGFAAFCAFGFFQAAASFHAAAVMRKAMGLEQGTEGLDG